MWALAVSLGIDSAKVTQIEYVLPPEYHQCVSSRDYEKSRRKPAVTAATPPAPNPQQVEKYEKCWADARAWFKANYSEAIRPLKAQGGGEILTTDGIDQNHYSRKLNRCFAVLVTTTTATSPRPPHAQVVMMHAIYDVSENRRVGVLVQKDLQTVTACEAEGTKCASEAEFASRERDYLTE